MTDPDKTSEERAGGMHGVSTLSANGTGTDDWIILHVDCDCFYAACERTRHPELTGEPLIIGMGYDEEDPHGAVATASYEAREYGVDSAMAIGKALKKLPRMTDADADDPDAPDPETAGYYRPVDMEFYESVGESIQEILEAHAETLEPVSIDEAYLDVTSETTWDDVESYAASLKETIREEIGVPVSIGAAPTKSAAKVASDHDKPDGLVIVEPGDVREFFKPLPIDEVHGIGPVTAKELRGMGIETAGDLAITDPDELTDRFGTRGKEAHQRARGHDPRPVTPPDDPKSLSNESSFGGAVTESGLKREKIRELADEVTTRAREQDALYQTIGIKVVEPPFDVNTRAHTLPGPVDNPELVEETALELLEEFKRTEVRKIGVKVSNLSFSEKKQAALTEWDGDETTETDGGNASIRGSWSSRTGSTEPHQSSLTDFPESGS